MTPDQARLLVLEDRIQEDIPKFEVRFKDKSRGQKVIGALMFFNRSYMSSYVSTFHPYVYWPDEKDYRDSPWSSFKTLAHEYIHLLDAKRHPFWFGFSYLLPHLIALLALGAVVAAFHSLWWLLCLVALIAAAPLPSPWRTHWEMRGYTMTMAVAAWKHGNVKPDMTEWVAKEFTGWTYYKMWPYKKSTKRRLADAVGRIHSGDVLLTSCAFRKVKTIIDMSDEAVVQEALRIEHERKIRAQA